MTMMIGTAGLRGLVPGDKIRHHAQKIVWTIKKIEPAPVLQARRYVLVSTELGTKRLSGATIAMIYIKEE